MQEPAVSPRRALPRRIPPRGGGMAVNLLVVDDAPKIVELLRKYLEREGWRVEAALDGRAALQAVATRPPDLVLLDLNLPEVSGTEGCRRLRGRARVPIIMLTARDEETDKV